MKKEIAFNEFIWLLKDNGIYTSFLRNIKEQTKRRLRWCNGSYSNYFNGSVDETLMDFYNKIRSKKNIFYFSFEWMFTKEGHDFWQKINVKYRSCLNGK